MPLIPVFGSEAGGSLVFTVNLVYMVSPCFKK